MWKDLQYIEQKRSTKELLSLWRHLRRELEFRTLLFYRTPNCHCWLEDILEQDNLSTTIYLWTSQKKPQYLKLQQSLNIFGLVCMAAEEFNEVLAALSRMFNHMREIPMLLQIGCDSQPSDGTEAIAKVILRRCYELLIPNVIFLASDFFSAGNLYAYHNYPVFQVYTVNYNSNIILYPYKLGNLCGQPIRVEPNILEPFTIASKARNGSIIITGMLWRLIEEFTRYYNGTLKLNNDITGPKSLMLHFSMLQNLANDTVDISAAVFPTRFSTIESFPFFSYPLMVRTWCIMLPVERIISFSEAMIGVLQSPWMWLYISIIYGLFRWLNGLSWRGRSHISLVFSLMRLTFICSVLAQLSAMFIHPQQLKRIETFEQIKLANIPIMGWRGEFNMYPEELRIRYATLFISHENLVEFLKLRQSFNTSFAYTVGEDKYMMYKETQKYFKRPLFRYSYDLCMRRINPHSLLYQENWLFRHQFDAFVLRLQHSGILDWWQSNGLYDMIRAGHATLRDLSTEVNARPITWKDWQFVMTLYAYALASALVMLLFELSVYYVNVCLTLV